MNSPSNSKKVDQHIYLSRSQLLEIEQKIRIQRHIERYALLRQFAKGVVCDAACGCGYGSYLLATNPDVEQVIGLDCEPDIISYAQQEYGTEKTEFHLADLGDWVSSRKTAEQCRTAASRTDWLYPLAAASRLSTVGGSCQ